MAITIKNEQDIEKMRIAGKLASEVLDFITPYVKPGVTTGELDKLCHDYMVNVQKTKGSNVRQPNPKNETCLLRQCRTQQLFPDWWKLPQNAWLYVTQHAHESKTNYGQLSHWSESLEW